MAGAGTEVGLRSFRDGDEATLVELWNRAHSQFGGYVRRTRDHWRWSILERPGVTPDSIILVERDTQVVAYGALAPGGTVLEFAVDPAIVGEERAMVAGMLVRALEERCLALGDEMIVFELPRVDGPVSRWLENADYRTEATGSLSLMVLDAARLIEAILNHRRPRFPHGWSPVFLLRLEPGRYRYHPETQLRVLVDPEVAVAVVGEDAAGIATGDLAARAESAAVEAREQGFERPAESRPPCVITTDRSTLSDMIFRRDSFDAALAAGRLRVEPASEQQDARTLMMLLALKAPWYTPIADGR